MGAASSKVREVTVIATSPIAGQEPGTSGLRKKTKIFMGQNYLQNFVQSVFDALYEQKVPVAGGTLVVSGDGRFYNPEAVQVIIKMAAANGVGAVWCGSDGLLSTPATSAVIRTRGKGFVPFGGFILSASHNPGGPDEDFGIKYNGENGGPAPEKVTTIMVEKTRSIKEYRICNSVPNIDLSKPGTTKFSDFTVEVFPCVEDHVMLLKQVFDFGKIKTLFARPDFSFVYDSMHGVQGPYAKAIFVDEFGAPPESCLNATPSPTFGPKHEHHGEMVSAHADPNLTHATELVKRMGLNSKGAKVAVEGKVPDFGAAADGDADRNMIMGKQFFCSPSDSLAVIVANATCIRWYKDGLKGCARSMPTSCALDRVAKKLGIPFFEVPTGWKFFGNLMDSGIKGGPFEKTPKYTPFICGEESFGTGGDHVREKDGMWAVLAWLQILASKNEDPSKPLIGVGEICMSHWKEFGRNYYARYDYEGILDPEDGGMNPAKKMIEDLVKKLPSLVGTEKGGMKIEKADMFAYNDSVDGSVSKNQGVRVIFEGGSRFVFRLSGTGSSGQTIRMYLEKYEPPNGHLDQDAFEVVMPLAAIALEVSGLTAKTGRTAPNVIT